MPSESVASKELKERLLSFLQGSITGKLNLLVLYLHFQNVGSLIVNRFVDDSVNQQAHFGEWWWQGNTLRQHEASDDTWNKVSLFLPWWWSPSCRHSGPGRCWHTSFWERSGRRCVCGLGRPQRSLLSKQADRQTDRTWESSSKPDTHFLVSKWIRIRITLLLFCCDSSLISSVN